MYELRQSPLNFYKYLRQGLETHGFTESDHDDYVFTNKHIMGLFWLDGCILYAKEASEDDKVTEGLEVYFFWNEKMIWLGS